MSIQPKERPHAECETVALQIHTLPDTMTTAGLAALLRRWHDAAPQASTLPREYIAGFFAELDALLPDCENVVIEP